MDNNNLEQNIKNSFGEYKPELDHDEIWDNIKPQLKKKKRRFLFVWFFGGLALIGLLSLYQFHGDENSVKSQSYSIGSKTATSSMALNESPTHITSNNANSNEEVKGLEANSEAQLVKSESINNEAPSVTKPKSQKDTKPAITGKRKNASTLSKKKSTPLTKNEEVSAGSSPTVAPSTSARTSPVIKDFQKQGFENIEVLEKIIEKKIPKELLVENKKTNPVDQSKNNSNKSEADIQKEKAERKSREKLTKQEIIKKANAKRKEDYKRKEASKKVSKRIRKKVKYFIQPTVSAIVPIRILKEKSGIEQVDYLNNRKDTEQQLEAYAIGLNFVAHTRRGILLMTGLEIQRLNSRYSFTETTQNTEVVTGVVSVTENALGQVISTTTGPLTQTRITEKTQRIHNNHTFVNLPVGIGKHWSNRNYDFQVMTGFNFNLYHNFNGLISGPTRDLDMRNSLERTFNQTFKRKVGMDFWVSSAFQKVINKNMSLSVAPRIQIPFSSITTSEYVLNQRFIKMSITLAATFWIRPETDQKKKK